ncbi:MAG: ATP-binding cassette domain-containing protein [Halanaerobium sp.]
MNKHLEIANITKTFGREIALNDINFSVDKGEFVSILGPSGCGKTTLLRIIAGLETPNQGKVYLKDKEITNLPPAGRNFGIVFQSYALFPNLTAKENIAYGLKNDGYSKKEIASKIEKVLSLVNLNNMEDKYPSQLSGGQQQRIALCRALAMDPDFLLLDEPLSALDAKVREKLRKEIKKLQRKLGITTILVTHDQEEALTMGDRVVVMNNATIEQFDTPQRIYEKPVNPFVADFIGNINFLEDENDADKLIAIRPEHIEITDKNKAENSIKAVVRDLEFRGTFYRIEFDVYRKCIGKKFLTVDLSANIVRNFNLKTGEEKNLLLPAERQLCFQNWQKEVI